MEQLYRQPHKLEGKNHALQGVLEIFEAKKELAE
jgi:hypothetical protein